MTNTKLGTLELAAMLAVARLASNAYGLAVRKDLAERTGRDLSVGALYTTLGRLEKKGFLISRTSEPTPVRGGRSRRMYQVTSAGAQAIREAEQHSVSIWAGLGSPIIPETT